MDNDNLLFAPNSTKIITGKLLDKSGCPFCNHKGGSDSTRTFLQEELPVKLRTCGNVYIHVCLNCHMRSILVQRQPTVNQQELLRAMIAEHYGGVADNRLMFVTMLRSSNK